MVIITMGKIKLRYSKRANALKNTVCFAEIIFSIKNRRTNNYDHWYSTTGATAL